MSSYHELVHALCSVYKFINYGPSYSCASRVRRTCVLTERISRTSMCTPVWCELDYGTGSRFRTIRLVSCGCTLYRLGYIQTYLCIARWTCRVMCCYASVGAHRRRPPVPHYRSIYAGILLASLSVIIICTVLVPRGCHAVGSFAQCTMYSTVPRVRIEPLMSCYMCT